MKPLEFKKKKKLFLIEIAYRRLHPSSLREAKLIILVSEKSLMIGRLKILSFYHQIASVKECFKNQKFTLEFPEKQSLMAASYCNRILILYGTKYMELRMIILSKSFSP